MSSRPIDEKIAKLSLDSSQFEKNATNAIRTFRDMNKTFAKSSSVDLSNLEKSVDSISGRFTLLGNIGQAAFQRIANTVLNLASQLNGVFGLGGAIAGFAEYELKLGSIQTIMVNTGESIEAVSDALNELNTYADQTIYSFSDMTRNIGLFTAAGVDLATSVSSIKGLANLAAGMGVSNEAAARATWQLSQALGTGYVRLQDWMSVENAGLGGEYFQKALVEHANAIGALSLSYDELKEKYGSFRNSLTEGAWLTNDVLAATLADFANDATLQDAATKVKSFSQLVDTVKESVGSGWAQTWEILFGNLEEAKSFWSPIADAITGFVSKSNDSRNKFLQDWKDLGGLESALNGIKNIFTGLDHLFAPVIEGFKNLISDVTPKKAADLAKSFENLTSKFANADFSSFSNMVTGVFDTLSGALGKLGDGVSSLLEKLSIKHLFAGLAGGGLILIGKKIIGVLTTVKEALDDFLGKGGNKIDSIKDKVTGLFDDMGESIQSFTSGIRTGQLLAIASAIGILTLSISKLSTIKGSSVVGSLTAIGVMLTELAGAFALIQLSLKKFKVDGVLKTGVSIVAIAGAVYILAGAVEKLSSVDPDKIGQGLIGVGVGLAELVVALKVLDGSKISLSTSIAILAVAEACQVLATAVKSFSGMNWDELGRGLTGMGAALAELVAAVSILGKFGGFSSLLGGSSIFIVSKSLDDISNALSSIGALDWETIKRGLVGIGGAFAEIGIVISAVGKIAGLSSLFAGGAILITVQGLSDVTTALKDIGALDWETIKRGLSGMGGALAEIGIVTGALGKLSGFSGLLGAGSLLLSVQSLKPIGDALAQVGTLDWETIKRGLVGLGGALTEVAVISGLTGSLTGIAGLVGAGTITLASQGLGQLADAFIKFGSMDWDSIGRGLAAMGSAMGETALGGLLNTFSGFGANSIATMAPALGTLADSLQKWKNVTIPENLSSQLGQLASGVMKFTLGGFGADTVSKIAAPMGTLATSISKWKDVSIPENIGTELGNLADGVKAFTLGGWGADALSSVAKPIGTLAISLKKWDGLNIPSNMESILTGLANGVKAFTTAFVGGLSIDSIVGPLGSLANSVKKWNGIVIPEGLGNQLKQLASGIKAFSGINSEGFGSLDNLGPAIEKISAASTSLASVDFSGATNAITAFVNSLNVIPAQIQSLGSAMSTAATSSVASFTTAFTVGIQATASSATASIGSMFASISSAISSKGSSIASQLMQIGNKWMSQLTSGINAKKASVTNAVKQVMNTAADQAEGYYDDFYSAGSDAMAGLAAGISAGGSRAISNAASVARRALAAAKEELDINSPSKKFEEVGMYSDQGLANGFSKFSNVVIGAVRGVATSALNTIQSDFSNQQFDMKPRVTPIVDSSKLDALSNFRQQLDLTALLRDKTRQNGSEKDSKLLQLLQAYNNKMDQFMDKLEDIKLYLHINGFEVDGETLTDVIDEVHTIRDLLDKTGKGE